MRRSYIFKNYWWIALLVGGLAAGFSFHCGGEDWVGLLGASIAGALGFCYFVQQQKLAETVLFHQLFTAFNARYDKLNGALAEIAAQDASLEPRQRNIIVDYFNLSAEEYLFYTEGYIPRDVWRSWCRGMSWYLKMQPFRDTWEEEVKTEFFYGLSIDEIDRGAI